MNSLGKLVFVKDIITDDNIVFDATGYNSGIYYYSLYCKWLQI